MYHNVTHHLHSTHSTTDHSTTDGTTAPRHRDTTKDGEEARNNGFDVRRTVFRRVVCCCVTLFSFVLSYYFRAFVRSCRSFTRSLRATLTTQRMEKSTGSYSNESVGTNTEKMAMVPVQMWVGRRKWKSATNVQWNGQSNNDTVTPRRGDVAAVGVFSGVADFHRQVFYGVFYKPSSA